MEAALNQNLTEIYHIDTIDPSNTSYINDENVNATPTTYFVKDGVIVEIVVGYKTTADIEQILIASLS